ncbi:hypothetical protein SBOR_6742 [Sclerotinia borealis F-4128]|uniref:Uncharacterized protein n=1 Tax=Sclerotinia borealis (strain F-4128) TaxID=1432307 RepID=W9CDJ9_SCLBF|nr:hypothetical protein SBOR_6742 [Sclerotinia borealis F-4128]
MPVLIFVAPLETPSSVLASTTTSSDLSATTSINWQTIALSPASGPQSTPTHSVTSTSSSGPTSTASQATITLSSDNKVTSSDTGSHIGAIIGGLVGGIALIACISFGIWLLRRHGKKHNQLPTTKPSSPSDNVKDPIYHVHELMEKSGNTPELGGDMIMAEADSPGIDRPPAELEA